MMSETPLTFPEKEGHFCLPGPAGPLEVKTLAPVTPRPGNPLVLVAHPNPLQEGTMDNKVVHTLAKTFSQNGWHAVRFNFRGVGQSAGTYGDTDGEVADMEAVLQWALAAGAPKTIWFAGFSFGSYIAARVAVSHPPDHVISLAPPCHYLDFDALSIDCPWTVILPTADEVVPPSEMRAFVERHPADIDVVTFEGCSHFFHGRLVDLRQAIEQMINE